MTRWLIPKTIGKIWMADALKMTFTKISSFRDGLYACGVGVVSCQPAHRPGVE
jgi:hypothetical protein